MSERCTKHTKYERFVKHFWQISRKDENVLNLYLFFFLICLYCYYCYQDYYCYHYYKIVIIIIIIIIDFIIIFIIVAIIVIIIIKFYSVSICFVFDRLRLWQGLEVWQISGDVKNKTNGGSPKVDENHDNIFIYCDVIIISILKYVLE